ncbi:MAG: hypothetical protein HN712_17555 [Gemmatimonadetes bacterium]|jgi:hypothetical protein|nr:hypothetical protein [Gemmatimonadota bacterium]
MSETPALQLVFIDLLFLLLAGGMGLWFRTWLRQETRRLDDRIEALEKQHKGLESVAERLTSVCRTIERATPGMARPTLGDAPASVPPPRRPVTNRPIRRAERTVTPPPPPSSESTPERQWEEMAERSREAYRLARELLEQGMSTTDVARQVGLGVAEVNVLKRMRDAAR